MTTDWRYMLGHQDEGRMRDCKGCGQVCIEYWLEVNNQEARCSRCCDYAHPEAHLSFMKRRKVVCNHCGKETQP
jgi:hypothetical protein